MKTSKSSLIRWLAFFSIWACVTSCGYAAGFYLTLATDYGGLLTLGLAVLIAGVLTSVFQGLLLWLVKRSGIFWFASSLIGHILAPFAVLFGLMVLEVVSIFNFNGSSEWLSSIVIGTIIGAVIGMGQWLPLRRYTARGSIWIIASVLMWALLIWELDSAGLNTCWGGTSPSQFWDCMPVIRTSVDFVLMGIVSGGTLVLLLGYFTATPLSLSRPTQSNPSARFSPSKRALLVTVLIVLLVIVGAVCVIGIGIALGIIPV